MTPLPMMLDKFNVNMYDHKRRGATAATTPSQADTAVDDKDDELLQILDDVEEIFGDRVFITHRSGS